MPRFYDPNLSHDPDHHSNHQKRVLKGHEGAGQFTAEDFHLARQQLSPRPAPAHPSLIPPPPPPGIPSPRRIISPFDPAGPQIQPSLFASPGSKPLSREEPGSQPFSREELEFLRAREELYELLSLRDTTGKRATATFRSRGFSAGDKGAVQVSELAVDQVKDVCKKFDTVQSFLDKADAATPPTRPGFNEAQRGTEIHWRVAEEVNGHRNPNLPPRDPNFRAETSLNKFLDVLEPDTIRKKLITAGYGQNGTIRIDVLEFVNDNTVCVYDIKTADALLGPKRMGHFAEVLFKYGSKHIIVIQMKPSHMYLR